jgi:Domain of unknown function (DUF5060)
MVNAMPAVLLPAAGIGLAPPVGMKVSMIASAILFLVAAQIEKPIQTVDVPKWSVYELTLTASDQTSDPYLETNLVGVFSGPNSQSVVVNAFWDGGRTFRIRFAPTVEGMWTYMTVSSDPAMDGHMGSIKVTPPVDGAHGFVRGPSARATDWRFDDGAPASQLAVRVIPLNASAAPCSANCGDLATLDRDHLSLAMLRVADRAVQESQAKGTIAQVLLFDAFDLSKFDDIQAHRVIDYVLARYGAYTNVAWCLHATPTPAPGSSDAAAAQQSGTHRTWTAMRGVMRMDDPYFVQSYSLRVLQNECSASGSTTATF